jgi:hypothetical protein
VAKHFRQLDPAPDNPFPLGRHQLHDDRSRDWDVVALLSPDQLTDAGAAKPRGISVNHVCHASPWNQGRIGSCTANAALGTLMCDPLWHAGWSFVERDAQQLYTEETRLDDSQIPGNWPPTDTGSTGLWSMQALKARGLISSYRHAFSLNAAIATLENQPISIGVPWYNSMFTPDTSTAVIPVDESSGVAGGHQVALVGVDAVRKQVRGRNSWGTRWGDGGYFLLSFDGLDLLLHQGGDVVAPVVGS